MMTKQDEISSFVKSNAKWIVIFCIILIFGLVVGVISSLKPVDPFETLSTHNNSIFIVIENASYLQFLFTSMVTYVSIVFLSAMFGRFSLSAILLISVTLVMGYFQSGTVILVVRVYGVISLPLVICYSVFSIFADIVLFCFFATLVKAGRERRKYGCKTSFAKTLLGSAYLMIVIILALLIRFFTVIAFSFFL